MVGKLPVPGRPSIWITVGQGPTALAVGAGGGCLDIFTLIYHFSPLSPSLWETARYRLKYCLKGPLNSKQLTKCNNTPHLKAKEPKQKSRLGTASNIIMGRGVKLVCGRPTRAIGSAFVHQTNNYEQQKQNDETQTKSKAHSWYSRAGDNNARITYKTNRHSIRGWLVGCFGLNGSLRQYFSLYRTGSQREAERGKKG